MLITRGFKYTCALTEEQKLKFEEYANVCNRVFNIYLNLRKFAFRYCYGYENESLKQKDRRLKLEAKYGPRKPVDPKLEAILQDILDHHPEKDLKERFKLVVKNFQSKNSPLSLSAIKKMDEYSFLKDPADSFLGYALRNLDSAVRGCFREKNKSAPPNFKNRKSFKSFKFRGRETHIERISGRKAFVKVPKIGVIKIIYDRPIVGKIIGATIIKEGLDWKISFSCEYDKPIIESPQRMVGIDRGITECIKLSDKDSPISENELTFPDREVNILREREKKIRRDLSRKNKGSKNWLKNLEKLKKISNKIVNVKDYYIGNATKKIADNYNCVVLEDLKIKNMTSSAKGTPEDPGKNVKAKSGLNREIINKKWGKFELDLKYKLEERGGLLVKVDPKNTSRTCPNCGSVDKNNRVGKLFKCTACCFSDDADYVGAVNILSRGKKLIEEERKLK